MSIRKSISRITRDVLTAGATSWESITGKPTAVENLSGTNTGDQANIYGIIRPSANGTVIARFASEVLSSAIVAKAGSVCYYQQTL